MSLPKNGEAEKANLVVISALKAKNAGYISAELFDSVKAHTILPEKFFLVFSDHSGATDVQHHNTIVLNARNHGDVTIPVVDVNVDGKKYHASLVRVANKKDIPALFPEGKTQYVNDMQDVGAVLTKLTKPSRNLRDVPVAQRNSLSSFNVDRTATPLSQQAR